MNEPEIRYLLKAIQVDLTRYTHTGSKERQIWLNIRCPFAPWRHQGGQDNTPSFGVTISEDRRSIYKCFSCGSKGKLAQLPSQLGHLRKRDYNKHRKWAELAELQASISRPLPSWENYNADIDTGTMGSDAATVRPESVDATGYGRALGHPYLRERGINWQAVLLADLRYDDFQQRILFPVYDRDEVFVGFTGRSTRKGNSTTKGRDPKVRDYFGLPKRETFLRLRKNDRFLTNGTAGHRDRLGRKLLVEGLFDYANLVGLGYRNTHAILGTSSTPEKIDLLISEGDPVFFLMDNDLAGWQALFGIHDPDEQPQTENAWAYQLYREVPVWIVPYQTVFDGTDPGSLSASQVSKMLSRAWLFTGKTPLTDLEEPSWGCG